MRVVACRGRIQVTALMQARVESVDLVPEQAQKADENGSDVTPIACCENSHRYPKVRDTGRTRDERISLQVRRPATACC